MTQAGALTQAMALVDAPLFSQAMRAQPLPRDLRVLLEIVAGNAEALARAATEVSVAPEKVREAAVVYLQHVVFSPTADPYRILAVPPDASQARIREHVALLLKWLHPDRAQSEWESVFARRVVTAWNALKTAERRESYASVSPTQAGPRLTPSGRRRAVIRPPRGFPLVARSHEQGPTWLVRLAALLAAGVLAGVVIFAPRMIAPPPAGEPEQPTVAASGGS